MPSLHPEQPGLAGEESGKVWVQTGFVDILENVIQRLSVIGSSMVPRRLVCVTVKFRSSLGMLCSLKQRQLNACSGTFPYGFEMGCFNIFTFNVFTDEEVLSCAELQESESRFD